MSSKCCNFLYCPNSLLCSTIFSNRLSSSKGKSAAMNAYTVQLTSSTFLLSGNAELTTCSTMAFLCSFSGSRTRAQTSLFCLSTKYRACSRYSAFELVNWISSESH